MVNVKRISVVIAVAVIVLCLGVAPGLAASEDAIEESIEAGLAWLAAQQDPVGGYWGATTCERVGFTGFALLKMEDRAYELGYDSPFDPEYEYASNVDLGFDYIFNYYNDAGDTDGDGVHEGFFYNSECNYHQTYSTAVALMAISSSGTPDRVVDVGSPFALGKTYKQIAEECVEWFIEAQNPDGAWRYYAGEEPSDQSNSGWVTMGLTYANVKFGIDIAEVLPGLQSWVNAIQNTDMASPYYGGSMYTVGGSWENILKTGSLLYQFAMVSTPVTDTNVQAAIGFIENFWNAGIDTGWTDHRQAMFCMMKGLEAYNVELLDLDGDDVPETDWFDVVSSHLVGTQNADGSWPGDYWAGQEASTAWALLTLERSVIIPVLEVPVDMKPGSCPNSYNVGQKGVLPAAILGTDEFDVSDIDPATIRLVACDEEDPAAGVAPLRWNYEKVAQPAEDADCDCETCDEYNCWESAYDGDVGDEYMDLTLKFDSVAVSAYLGDVDPGCMKIKLVGTLKEEEGGTAFEGCDTLRLLVK